MTQTAEPATAAPSAQRRHKTLVFHIGDRKTGSTSIQMAFAQNRIELKGSAVFYPTQLSHNWLKSHCQAYGAANRPVMRKQAIAIFEKLAKRIRKSDADFCLISAESLEAVDPHVFHDIVTTYFATAADDIRVVAYVRPHAARLLSNFAEQTKIGSFRAGLEPYFRHVLSKERLHYQQRFAAWRAVFGTQFTLRPMIRSQLVNGSVVDDFVEHAFGQSEFRVSGGAATNESLCLEDLMRLKVLQSRCARTPQKLRHALGWEFSRLVAALPPCQTRTRLQLHKALAGDIHAAYLKDARAIDQQFFDGAPLLETELDTALETAPETAQSVAPGDHFSAAEIRSLHLLSDIIAGMLENGGEKWLASLKSRRIGTTNAGPEPGDDRPERPI